jgi:hypothetical protein
MSNNIIPSEVNNNIVCEAIGCYSKATNTIELKIGSNRTVSLLLCSECRSKLRLSKRTRTAISQHRHPASEEDDNP